MPLRGHGLFSRFSYGSSRWNAFALLVLTLVFAFSTVWLFRVVGTRSAELTAIRTAQEARVRVLELRLDEESSMRRFANSRDPAFLSGLQRAEAVFSPALETLRTAVAAIDAPTLLPFVADESAGHTAWLRDVAAAVQTDPAHRSAQMLSSVQYVDAFRRADQRLYAILDERSDAVDSAGRRALVPALLLTAFVVLSITAAFLYYGARQAKMALQVEAEVGRTERQRAIAVHEKQIADRLQEAFLQQQLPALSNVGFSATYMPASSEAAVGGDWYDAFELPDGRIMFSIGDVVGHGIEAAVTMSRARHAIVAAALQETDPGAVLERANVAFMLQDTKFATAICGYITPRTLEVVYATAGHPPAILVGPDGSARTLPFDGLPLGVAHDATYPAFTLRAEHQSLLILYTDGLVEYDRDLIAGEERIIEAARAVAKMGIENPAAAIQAAIFDAYQPNDDVAIMTVSFSDYVLADSGPGGNDGERRWAVGFRGIRAPFSVERPVLR